MSTRDSFVRRFGEADADRIAAAAEEHDWAMTGVYSLEPRGKGSDPFRWAIAIAIGYECMSSDQYRTYHGIEATWPELRAWIIEDGDLASHDGGFDHMAMFVGAYNEFMPVKVD